MSEGILELSDEQFEGQVLKHDKPTLVDFWAEWCTPCRALTPIVEEVAKTYAGKIQVGKLNIDDHRQVPGRYRVSAVPTLLLFKDGEVVEQLVGLVNKQKLSEIVDKHLA